MDTARFVSTQRKGVNGICALFAIVVSIVWVATLCDWSFNLGWGYDQQMLWTAPLGLLFAIALRWVAMGIFKFVEDNY
jgi:hypothetical protein